MKTVILFSQEEPNPKTRIPKKTYPTIRSKCNKLQQTVTCCLKRHSRNNAQRHVIRENYSVWLEESELVMRLPGIGGEKTLVCMYIYIYILRSIREESTRRRRFLTPWPIVARVYAVQSRIVRRQSGWISGSSSVGEGR